MCSSDLGDAVQVLPGAFARVPADALPVVTTTWALSHFPLQSRLRFLHRLDEAAAGREPVMGRAGRSAVAIELTDEERPRTSATGSRPGTTTGH